MEKKLLKRVFIIVTVFLILCFVFFLGSAWFKNIFSQATVIKIQTEKINQHYSIVGSSEEGRKIEAYTYGDGPRHLVFVGGIHGGYEWNSVLLAYKFIDSLIADPGVVPKNITITVIPSANPDGLYKVIGKNGRFTISDLPANVPEGLGRLNTNEVDLNRNFDCNWQATSTWKNKPVSGGETVFSESETRVIRDYILRVKPEAVVFWHSKANAVYASECNSGILSETINIMNAYATASGYRAVKSFDSYKVTGDAEGWLASINIPAITVELENHETVEWEKNLAGIKALLNYYSNK